ncbi:S8 family peptidase [Actinoplanes rectilineatus]|uniref:S8 family peptidase n=1 Tax=Actinoplanes rectilineatus TaxID=113571 RepID=UPI0005F2A67D|nr:S8 family peptidase [Actinoplanes rectilineatus]
MKVQLRRYAAGAVAAGALAAVGVLALPTASAAWEPVTYGLSQSPEQLLPAVVSVAAPARVVSTTVGDDGRPVVTVTEATDKKTAVKLVEAGQRADDAVSVEVDAEVSALDVPADNDPYRGQQWDLGKIRVGDAWKQSTGAGVVVAVLDTGVDAAHPDLAGHVLDGYDAITDSAGGGTDTQGHGTHVAGTIAAATGNGVGVAAVAPDVRILPVRVLGTDGTGYMSDTAEGIIWAADHGAQVINMSLGASAKVTAVTNAIAYARSKGVTVVAAAGNSRAQGSPVNYPGADAGVIGVAATDSTDTVASYSNAGDYVDVAAPGSGILSTYPTAKGNGYAYMNGTSMATPHVAAVAALLKAFQPSLTPDGIESALESSAVDLGAAGRDNDYGYGRIDAAAALAAVTPAGSTPTTAPTTTVPTTATTTAPTTEPTTAAPTTEPTTAAPTVAPTTEPTTAAPTTAPTTAAPTTAPTSVAPTTKAPTTAPTPVKTVAKVKPVVTSNVSTREVAYGTATSTTFTVRLSGKAYAGKVVSVCVTEAGAAVRCTSAQTTTAGTVVVNRPGTAGFRVYLSVPESETALAATSPTATWTVRAKVAAARSAKGVMTVTLTGVAGQTVQVQQLAGGRWTTVGTFPAAARTTVNGLTANQKYRVVVPDTIAVLGVTSTTVTT